VSIFRIFVEVHRFFHSAALFIDPGADLPRLGQKAVRLPRPVARTGRARDHRVHLVDYRADLRLVAHG
jgi:hypothetical protein